MYAHNESGTVAEKPAIKYNDDDECNETTTRMNISPTDNVEFLIKQAQSVQENNVRIRRYWDDRHAVHERERTSQERLNRNREMMMLDKQYYEKAHDKSKMVKGTNVDLFI